MNKYISNILLGIFLFTLSACNQDIDFPYQGKDRIQFRHYTTDEYTGVRTYTDSLIFSFGMIPDNIQIDTAKIVVEYLGRGASFDRTYKVVVEQDSATAQAGIHYEAFSEIQTFKANSLTDTLRIVVYREHLSKSFANPENVGITLRLEPTTDFDLGLEQGIKKRLLFNDYLTEPEWWEGNFWGGLNFYHPKKWRILMSFNKEAFSDPNNCPYDFNSGRIYMSGLRTYLEVNEVYDDETGDRIYMDRYEPQPENNQ